jgi:hypothetical protein
MDEREPPLADLEDATGALAKGDGVAEPGVCTVYSFEGPEEPTERDATGHLRGAVQTEGVADMVEQQRARWQAVLTEDDGARGLPADRDAGGRVESALDGCAPG